MSTLCSENKTRSLFVLYLREKNDSIYTKILENV